MRTRHENKSEGIDKTTRSKQWRNLVREFEIEGKKMKEIEENFELFRSSFFLNPLQKNMIKRKKNTLRIIFLLQIAVCMTMRLVVSLAQESVVLLLMLAIMPHHP
jgi:hypothetical protein